jgi:putative PIN family toxin of toxin-antitoxin system
MGKKSRKVRVVLDTNTLISALGWNGVERVLVKECLKGEHDLYTSNQILEEVSRVLDYQNSAL